MSLVQRRNFRPLTDLSAIVDAIRTEGRASRAEERREDRGKRLREWITIALLAITAFVIWKQVREMERAYQPIEEQAAATKKAAEAALKQAAASQTAADASLKQVQDAESALTLAQRAWVGPSNAALTAAPQPGKPADLAITYQNSGREPALNLIYDVDAFAMENTAITDELARIDSYRQVCRTANQPPGGSVVYPATGSFSSYNLSSTIAASNFDAQFLNGHEVLVIQGCFWYRTFKMQKHSYFCYYYDPKQTKITNLNICKIGADAN